MQDTGSGHVERKQVNEIYHQSYKKRVVLLVIITILLFAAVLYSASVGTARLSIGDVFTAITHNLSVKTGRHPAAGTASGIVRRAAERHGGDHCRQYASAADFAGRC